MTRMICAVVLLGLSSFHVVSQPIVPGSPPDSIFKGWGRGMPGGVVLVVLEGKTVCRKAFGLGDLTKNIPNAPELKYDLASNAKQFTGMCIALLEEQGRLSIDDDIRKYYPALKITEEIRIRNLLAHTSGLRDAAVLAVLSGKMNLKGEVRKHYNTKAYYLECLMRETDLSYPVGTELAYNNFNYVLLGDIVEKVSGQSLSAFADSAIFKPLGMTHTILRDRRGLKIPGESTGYLFTGKKFKKSDALGGIVGDHNLVSTVDDLALWELNFFHNRLGKGDQSLVEKVCRSSKLKDGSLTHYGFGLWNTEYKGTSEVWHGGDDGRETSMLLRFPERELIVIVLANSSRYNDTERIAHQLAEFYLAGSLIEPDRKKEKFTFIELPVEALRKREGIYTRVNERGLGQLNKITLIDGNLYSTRNYNSKGLKLSAVSADRFVGLTMDKRKLVIQFTDSVRRSETKEDSVRRSETKEGSVRRSEAEADVPGLTETFADNPPRAYRLSKVVQVPYGDYVGAFRNKSTGATIKVRHRRGRIVARKGILRIPLIPFDRDQFYAYNNDALFTFRRDASGKVVSVRADAPDFRNFSFDLR